MSEWGEILAAAELDHASRLNHLNLRHRMNSRGRFNENYPPLTDPEEEERLHLTNWRADLSNRWHNMDPMSPEELSAHKNLNGVWANGERQLREPESLDERRKAAYYSDLHHEQSVGSSLTPRQQMHFDSMQPWAEDHFGYMQDDAKHNLDQWRQYDAAGGQHSDGAGSMRGTEFGDHPATTSMWAAEELNGDNPHLRHHALQYRGALASMARTGPHGIGQDGRYNHEVVEDAQNKMRVELQHQGRFRVPETDSLSPIQNPAEQHGLGYVVNPRWQIGTGQVDHGTPELNAAGQRAYKINCQRAVLAEEARNRGYNVEAAPNFQAEGSDISKNDKDFNDHQIASWFQKPEDAGIPQWRDIEDHHPEVPPGPEHWDLMTKHIESWGPGARGVVAMSYPTPGGGPNDHKRHVISAHVDKNGVAQFADPQSGASSVEHKWRDRLAYGQHQGFGGIRSETNERIKSGLTTPDRGLTMNNTFYSPLRVLRMDDKGLHPEASKHMIDRGTASITPIIPPADL